MLPVTILLRENHTLDDISRFPGRGLSQLTIDQTPCANVEANFDSNIIIFINNLEKGCIAHLVADEHTP